jgi:glycosyltransferase involved in cell wall biosynthesis
MTERLRFLMIIHTVWSRSLGAPRVPIEFAEELRGLGDDVQKFSYEDAFPEALRPRRRGAIGSILGLLGTNRSFAAHARRFVRTHGRDFDVIEASQTDLPYSKSELGYSGLLVARCAGLIPAYEEFESMARRRWPQPSSPRQLVERLLTLPGRRRRLRHVTPSFHHADLVNVPNTDEFSVLAKSHGTKVVYFPLGLSETRLKALRCQRASPDERLAAKTVAFIGTWNERKGARDWPSILTNLQRLVPGARLLLLGTGIDSRRVRADFPDGAPVEIVQSFETEELPRLLTRATVGGFPGYLEGFGFGVLEKIAAGLPTVAYDAPGPRDILGRLSDPALVPIGDHSGFASKLAEFMQMSVERYAERAAEGERVASTFAWREIAVATRERYRSELTKLGRR